MRPSVIRVNYGIQRSERGGMAMRAVTMLPCLIGSWKEVGGGLQMSLSGSFGLNNAALEMPELMQKALGRPARTVNMVQLGTALNSLDRPAGEGAVCLQLESRGSLPQSQRRSFAGSSGLTFSRLCTNNSSPTPRTTPTSLLPATTFFEHKDLQAAYGHYYLQVSDQAMEPVGECRSNVELFRALAERMGFEDDCFRETVDSMIDRALDSPNPFLKGITRERLESEQQIRLNFGTQRAQRTTLLFSPSRTATSQRPAARPSSTARP